MHIPHYSAPLKTLLLSLIITLLAIPLSQAQKAAGVSEESEKLFARREKLSGYGELNYSELYDDHIAQALTGDPKSQVFVAMALSDCQTSEVKTDEEINNITIETRGLGLPEGLAEQAMYHARACQIILSESKDLYADAKKWTARASSQLSAFGRLYEIDRGWHEAPVTLEEEISLVIGAFQESSGDQIIETLAFSRAVVIMFDNRSASDLTKAAWYLLLCERHFRCLVDHEKVLIAEYKQYEVDEIISKSNAYRQAIDSGRWEALKEILLGPPRGR